MKKLHLLVVATVLAVIVSLCAVNVVWACDPPPPCEPQINIKPYSDPNNINLNGNGAVTVAILPNGCFDAADVALSTVDFEGASPWKSELEDVDGDGEMDLLMHFRIKEATGIEPGDTSATLTWQANGTAYSASDSIVVRGK